MEAQQSGKGMNLTGAELKPGQTQAMVEGAQSAEVPPGDVESLGPVHVDYIRASGPVGSLPPASDEGTPSEAAFLDRIAERLAFERSGTRLYEALLIKLDAEGSFRGGPTREDLESIHDDELEHFLMLREAIELLGGDPTMMTPCADVVGVEAMGIGQVVADPRTTLPQSLLAILTAELADGDGWRMLIEIARARGEEEMAARFAEAAQDEAQHLAAVRTWMSRAPFAPPSAELGKAG